MTAKSEVRHLSPEELFPEELDAVSGGMNVLLLPLAAFSCRSQEGGGGGSKRSGPNVSTDNAATHRGLNRLRPSCLHDRASMEVACKTSGRNG